MRFRGLDLNLLVALDVLFQELNVTRAATRLNTTQSTMSGILARLRQHFRDELLVPYGRILRKTPLAEQLQGPLHEAIMQLENIVEADSGFDASVSIRHFRVEFPDHLIPVLLPRITRRITERAPNVSLEFSLPRGDPTPLLHRGELDLVVTPRSYGNAEYRSVPLLKDALVVVGWADNPALQGPINTELLTHLPMINVRVDPNRVRTALTKELIALIQDRKHTVIIAPTFSSIPRMLVGSPAFAVLHRNLVECFTQQLPLVIHDLPFETPQHEDVVMFHPNRAADQGLMWLISQLLESSEEI